MEDFEALGKTQKTAAHWQADPTLVGLLVEAEREWTLTTVSEWDRLEADD